MKKTSNWTRTILVVILGLAVFCMIATTFQLFSIADLTTNMVGALLEAVLTAVITVVLLAGQTSAEEVKERNVKVFEEKSATFRKYIGVVWSVWEDHKVTDEEYLQLTRLYYQELMLYMKKQSLSKVGNAIKIIGKYAEKDISGDSFKELQGAVTDIISTLSDEIDLGGEFDLNLFNELDQQVSISSERSRATNNTFASLGIPIGSILALKRDPAKICKTIDLKNQVEYNGKEYSISTLGKELLGTPISGFAAFTFNGSVLSELKRVKE
jgi:hypothetical protein